MLGQMSRIESIKTAGVDAENAPAAELRLSTIPLSDPAKILRRMPTQAISPALLKLLDLMSGPIRLVEYRPAGELITMPTVKPVLRKAA